MEGVDWEGLATELGLITKTEGGHSERGGTDDAREALEHILGIDCIRSAVDFYISHQPGFELARSVLWLLGPPSAMERCHEIFQTSPDILDRRAAVELLRIVADKRALAWAPEYLADPDAEIQGWGIGLVDQLLFSRRADFEDCSTILELATEHTNEHVVAKARELIKGWTDDAMEA